MAVSEVARASSAYSVVGGESLQTKAMSLVHLRTALILVVYLVSSHGI